MAKHSRTIRLTLFFWLFVGLACGPCNFLSREMPTPPRPLVVSTEAAAQLEARIQQSLQGVPGQQFILRMTDVEVTSLVASKLTEYEESPVTDPRIWFTKGKIYGTGRVKVFSIPTPFVVIASARIEDGQVVVAIEDSSAGMFPIPQRLLETISQSINETIQEIQLELEVTALEIDDPVTKIIDLVNKTNYSRIPVYRGNFDNPVGILYVKDLLQYIQKVEDINLKVLLRPIHYVPDTARLDIVLRQMQSMHLHMAVVVDEYGGVEGIVTLEDLLEEIVGEIRDEHDTETESVRELSPGLYAVAGNLPVNDFNRFFAEKIPEAPEYSTLAGFLQALTGRLLREGETVRYQNFILTVEKTEGFRIISVRVRTSAPIAKSKA